MKYKKGTKTDIRYMSLVEMEQGQSGAIAEIRGGIGLRSRLDTMGLRIGKSVVKISSSFLRGPVTVNVGATQLSLGFGMASKVIVEIEEPDR